MSRARGRAKPTWQTPPSLLSALNARLGLVDISLDRQTAALQELFEIFTTERGRLPHLNYLDTPRLRQAYLLYHLPLNVARCACVLRDILKLAPELSGMESIVDLGAGPGSGSLATLTTLPGDRERSFLLTDRSRSALRVARELIEDCARGEGGPAPRITCRVQRLPSLPPIPQRSVVWLSMVLNELFPESRREFEPGDFLERLDESLGPDSVLIIVEPALRLPGRRLLEIHDALIRSSRWRVIAPCTHQKACPLLAVKTRPWCHVHFGWKAPAFVEDVAAPLNLDLERGSFSYLAVRRLGAREDPGSPTPDAARAVGDPMRVAGGKGIYICRDGERRTLRNPHEDVQRGDRVICAGSRLERIVERWAGFGGGDRTAGKKTAGKKPEARRRRRSP